MQPAHVNDACIHLSFLANRLAVNGADWHSQGDRREICSSKFSAGRRRRSQRHVRRRRRGDGSEEELEGKGMERRDEADVCPRLPAGRGGTGAHWRLPSASGLIPLGRRRCRSYYTTRGRSHTFAALWCGRAWHFDTPPFMLFPTSLSFFISIDYTTVCQSYHNLPKFNRRMHRKQNFAVWLISALLVDSDRWEIFT